VVGVTRSIARELGRYNVRCHAIRPRADTRMATPQARAPMQRMQDTMGAPMVGDRWFDAAAENRPEEVGVLVAWLCTDAAANVNGRTFQAGGGEVGLYSEPEARQPRGAGRDGQAEGRRDREHRLDFGQFADYSNSPYNAFKAAVINFTRVVAMEYAREGIRCNCVFPGGDRPLRRSAG
jgi:NAD(P)-dependent dehydrogenase (short-subunit alcohol dehydrogenase family)